jgi:uncharacterized protein (DUF433 family)
MGQDNLGNDRFDGLLSEKPYIVFMKAVKDFITVDPEILGGKPVFRGTLVPVESLFDHLEKGITVDEFLEDFPTVSKNQVIIAMEMASKLMSSGLLKDILDLLEKEEEDPIQFSTEQENLVKESELQYKKGKTISNEDVQKKLDEWLGG